jgi:hypothetical protein
MEVVLKTIGMRLDRDIPQRPFLVLGSRLSLGDSALRIDFAPLGPSFYSIAFSQGLSLLRLTQSPRKLVARATVPPSRIWISSSE